MNWFVSGAVLLLATSAQAGSYSLTYLAPLPDQGFSYAYGISSSGQVVGASGFGDYRAVDWGQGGPATGLGFLPGGNVSQARAVNGAGQIVGYSGTSSNDLNATLYTPGEGLHNLGTLPGKTTSVGNAINETGQVAGYSQGPSGLGVAQQAFRWSPQTGMVGLAGPGSAGNTIAWGINDQGQVVGQASGSGGASAAFWDVDGSLTLIGDSTNTAQDVNDAGQVVGARTSSPLGPNHAFVWTSTGGVKDLGTLGGYDSSFAKSINEQGAVVGFSGTVGFDSRAFLWTPQGGMIDLNSLIDPSSGFVLETATGINDAGQIIGYGQLNGFPDRAFLLTPVPEPASLAALTLGALGVLRRRTRKA